MTNRIGVLVRIRERAAEGAPTWLRPLALLGVVAASCGEPSQKAAPTEPVGRVQEAVALSKVVGPGESRGALTLRLTFNAPGSMTDLSFNLAAEGMKPIPSLGSGTGALLWLSSYPSSGYWIAHKNSPNQGEWVSHLLKTKAPPSPQPFWLGGGALWLTHSAFIPTGTVGPGGIVATDPPGLINGQGFVQPAPEGGALLNPVISAPGSGPEGTRWKWTNGPADTGVALRVDDQHLQRVGIVQNEVNHRSFLIEVKVVVPPHPERAGAVIGNAVRPLMFLQRGGQDLYTSASGMLMQSVDFSAYLNQWVSLQMRADVTTAGGALADSSDDLVRVKYRSYINEQLIHTEEPALNTAVVQAQTGPILIGPGYALLRGHQGDAPEAFLDELEMHFIGATPLLPGESLSPTPIWTETFGNRGADVGAPLSDFKFVPHNSTPERIVRLYDPTVAQASGTTVIAYKGSANVERVTQYIPHFAPGANCTTPLSADCLLPGGGTFDGTAMWISHSRFLPQNGSLGPPPIGQNSPPAIGRRYDGTDVPADNGAYVRPADAYLFQIPFQDGATLKKSYLVSADLYVPSHVSTHEWLRIVPYASRGAHVDPGWGGATETRLIGLTNAWHRFDIRVDATTYGGGAGTADDKADIHLQFIPDVDAYAYAGAYKKLDAIAGAGTGNLKFGVGYGTFRGWQGDAIEAFFDNISVREIFPSKTCDDDTDCPTTGQTCGNDNGKLFGFPEGTRVCWDATCDAPSTAECGSVLAKCGLCPTGSACSADSNCLYGACSNGLCSCSPQCDGTTCGDPDACGGTCECGPGEAGCQLDTDCESGLTCLNGTCGPPGCRVNPIAFGCGYPGAACGPTCTRNPQCNVTADCPTGLVCPENNGWRYGLPQGTSVCERTDCPQAGCGTPASECGLCPVCEPSCGGKSCGDPDLSDGCGGRCEELCADSESGCSFHTDCQSGSLCLSGVCRPADCTSLPLAPPDCGTPTAICGPICPTPDVAAPCEDRVCGPDPAHGGNCGTCSVGSICNAAGRCVDAPDAPTVTVTNPNGTIRDIAPAPSPPAVSFGTLSGALAVSDHGSATYAIPLEVPPGRAGIQPSLALTYDSTTPNGIMGVGWSIEGFSSIKRCGRTFAQDGITRPVRGWQDGEPAQVGGADERDAFCLDGQRLALVGEREYRTSIDTFAKIVPEVVGNAIKAWRVYSKDGRVLTYGAAVRHRHGDSHTWALSEVKDRSENVMRITYARVPFAEETLSIFGVDLTPTGELLPRAITYTGHGATEGDRQVTFSYSDERSDAMSGWRAGGVPVQRSRRLESVDMRIRGVLVRRYELGYDETYLNTMRLHTMRECVGSDASVCKPESHFDYYDESGFADPVIVGSQLKKGNGDHARSWPVGNILPRTGGDFLNTNFQNSRYTWVQPIPDGVAIAVNFVPSWGHVLGATANALNVLAGGWDYEAGEIYSMTFNPIHSTLAFEHETCGGNATDQLLFHPAGGPTEGTPASAVVVHRQCPTSMATGVEYAITTGLIDIDGPQQISFTPLSWFVDVDGDGVQDKLFCSDPEFVPGPDAFLCGPAPLPACAHQAEPALHYALAGTWNNPPRIPVTADEESSHGTIPRAFQSLCKLDVDDCAFTKPRHQRPVTCTSERPFSMAFDIDGDGTGNLIVYDSEFEGTELAWAVLVFAQGAGPQRSPQRSHEA